MVASKAKSCLSCSIRIVPICDRQGRLAEICTLRTSKDNTYAILEGRGCSEAKLKTVELNKVIVMCAGTPTCEVRNLGIAVLCELHYRRGIEALAPVTVIRADDGRSCGIGIGSGFGIGIGSGLGIRIGSGHRIKIGLGYLNAEVRSCESCSSNVKLAVCIKSGCKN